MRLNHAMRSRIHAKLATSANNRAQRQKPVVATREENNMAEPNFTGLSSGETEVVRQLFFHGPTWDGNIVSKPDRKKLVDSGDVEHAHGFAWLTRKGVAYAISIGLDRAKEKLGQR